MDFIKAFGTVSHDSLISKFRKCRVDKWTVRWTENLAEQQFSKVMISGTGSHWRPAISCVSQNSVLDLVFNLDEGIECTPHPIH